MKTVLLFIIIIFLSSCIQLQPYIVGNVTENTYTNKFMSMEFPDGWVVRKSSGHTIFTLQKQIKSNNTTDFATILLEAGSINENEFSVYFDNLKDLSFGEHEAFSNNDIYKTFETIDSLEINGVQMFSFETLINNSNFNIPDLRQRHYYFKVDTVYFNLNISDYDRFPELMKEYNLIINSINANK